MASDITNQRTDREEKESLEEELIGAVKLLEEHGCCKVEGIGAVNRRDDAWAVFSRGRTSSVQNQSLVGNLTTSKVVEYICPNPQAEFSTRWIATTVYGVFLMLGRSIIEHDK